MEKSKKGFGIEWDPVMIQISEDLELFKNYHTNIILGDAFQESLKLQEQFDLIVIDIFKGGKVSPRVGQLRFISNLLWILTSDGYLILNIFEQPEFFDGFNRIFHQKSTWNFAYNTLGLYRHMENWKLKYFSNVWRHDWLQERSIGALLYNTICNTICMTIQNTIMLQAKTFRLPQKVIEFIEREAEENNISQGKVLENLVQKHSGTQNIWNMTLQILAQNQEYKKESLLLAGEDYE